MGYSVYWLGVGGKPRAQVLRELGLELGAETTDNYRPPLVGITLPDGWFVIMLNRYAPVWYSDAALASLSAGARVLTCEVEEHAMYSAATGFAGGRRVWRMVHDEGQGLDHLETEGELPSEFSVVYAEVKQRHDEAAAEAEELGEDVNVDHIFDVPPDLAEELAGYRHDAPLPPGSQMHELVALTDGTVDVIPAPIKPPPAPGDAPVSTAASPGKSPPPPSGPQSAGRPVVAVAMQRLRAAMRAASDAPWPERALALFVDACAACGLYVVSALLAMALMEWIGAPPAVEILLLLALVGGYLLLRDSIRGGTSWGKRYMALRVVPLYGVITTRRLSVRRNLPLVGVAMAGLLLMPLPVVGGALWTLACLGQLALFGYESYCVVSGRARLGDRLSGTRVITLRPRPATGDAARRRRV